MDDNEFKIAMSLLPEPPNDSRPPFWDYWRHDLWEKAQSDNPENFMGWPCVFHTMLVNHWIEPVSVEFAALPHDYYVAIGAPHFGKPHDYHANTDYSRNLIHQAYHLSQFAAKTGRDFSKMKRIVEVGGGYGAMALTLHRLGFDGEYVIYDLPEFALLQQLFLSKFDIEVTHYDGWMPSEQEADLLIGCYSLSEMDFIERSNLLNSVDAKSYLLLYSNRFAGYDNTEYFQKWATSKQDYNWSFNRIEHLPPESWYLFGDYAIKNA